LSQLAANSAQRKANTGSTQQTIVSRVAVRNS